MWETQSHLIWHLTAALAMATQIGLEDLLYRSTEEEAHELLQSAYPATIRICSRSATRIKVPASLPSGTTARAPKAIRLLTPCKNYKSTRAMAARVTTRKTISKIHTLRKTHSEKMGRNLQKPSSTTILTRMPCSMNYSAAHKPTATHIPNRQNHTYGR
jgi:hypothetical protein